MHGFQHDFCRDAQDYQSDANAQRALTRYQQDQRRNYKVELLLDRKAPKMTKIPDPDAPDGNENVCSVQQIGRLFRSREMFDRDEQSHRRKKCENEVIRWKYPGCPTQVETAKVAGDSRKAAFDLGTGTGQNSRDQKTTQHEE